MFERDASSDLHSVTANAHPRALSDGLPRHGNARRGEAEPDALRHTYPIQKQAEQGAVLKVSVRPSVNPRRKSAGVVKTLGYSIVSTGSRDLSLSWFMLGHLTSSSSLV